MFRRFIAVCAVVSTLAACGAIDQTAAPTQSARPTSAPTVAAQAEQPTNAPAVATQPEQPTAASATGGRPTSAAAGGAAAPELREPQQFPNGPEQVIDPTKSYTATLSTAHGDVVIQLFPQSAPLAVNSFVFLAQQGYYDNITFHRVIPGFVAQTGDPSGTGRGNPGYNFADEYDPALGLDYNQAGILGMANSGPNTNGSQFFITYGAVGLPPQQYTIFGQVASGMDVLQQLTPRDPQINPGAPLGDTLYTITIEEGK